MSRLYDELLAARGGEIDTVMAGAVSTFCDMLKLAQCFNISDQVSLTCSEMLRSKPSSIVSALDLTRVPYPLTWIEWTPGRLYEVQNEKPIPRKIGCLLASDKAGAKGYFVLAWVHGKHDVSLNPLGLIYDWDSKSTEPVITQYAKAHGLAGGQNRRETLVELASKAIPQGRWAHHRRTPEEIEAIISLEMRASLVPLEFCLPFIEQVNMLPGTGMYESYANDLNGELPFVEAFLLLLNSRNTIVEQTRDDFTKLNKARAKQRKPALKEFINTRIKLGRVQANRARIATGGRGPVETHLVRGHFKIRASGVYWWSPHIRGEGSALRPRKEYEVR